MRVPISWLKQYVDIESSPEELAEILTSAGLEVTAIEYLGVEGADLVWNRETVFLSRILKVERHPDADKLVLATVDFGSPEPKVVVTGAPNLYPFLERGDVAELGLLSPFLLAGGTYLDPYKDGKQTRLKGKKLRGIYNDAMLCSPAELGLGEDHGGILILGPEEIDGDPQAGTPLQDVLGDAVLDIDIIPNVARCASIVGVAREVAALTGVPLRLPDCEVVMEGDPIADRVKITTENPDLNPRFVAFLIEGVEQRPAPFWMQHRLRLVGQRPLNVVVDVSNYVMLELGQPNHTFDYDLLRRRANGYAGGGPVHILTRLARPQETLTTLDGTERRLHSNNILVTDPAGGLSIGGVMGGLESEIEPETRNVLLEAAAWNFINIRHTSRQLGLHTEAGFRFSRGVHPSQALLGAKRAAELLRREAGGTVAQGLVDYYPQPPAPVTVTLGPDYVRRLAGVDLGKNDVAHLLERLEFTVESEGEELAVTAPDHRLDIAGPHDLVEEVCRMVGYDRIPSSVLGDDLPPQRGNPTLEREERIKDVLVEEGLQEVVTYRLTTPQAEARVAIGDVDEGSYVRIQNPSTNERAVLRHSLLASVLEIATTNSRFQDTIQLFEVGHVYLGKRDQSLPTERPQLAVVVTGPRRLSHWQGPDGDEPGAMLDFFDLKGILEALAQALKVDLRYTAGEHPSFRPGRTAILDLGGDKTGVMGEIHPLVAERYELRFERHQPVLGAILELATLLPKVPDSFAVKPLPAYPAVREDLALVLDEATPAAELEAALLRAGAPLLVGVELFDVYRGEKVGAGKKSLAYHLAFQSPTKTLTDRDAGKLRNRILKQVEATVGATLRE